MQNEYKGKSTLQKKKKGQKQNSVSFNPNLLQILQDPT